MNCARKHVLFLCSANRLPSPTAEEVFRNEPGYEVSTAGADRDAENPVCSELVDWADILVVMEHHHRRNLTKRFPEELKGKRLVVLGIPDNYDRMDPVLIQKLPATTSKWRTDHPRAAT